MISEFETGKWYRYKGEKQYGWAPSMDFMLDGKPHKCIDGKGTEANFEGHIRGRTWPWTWGDLSDFEEVIPVIEFETGKTYMFVGDSSLQWFVGDSSSQWFSEEMKEALDGKPRKCIHGDGREAQFEGIEGNWRWRPELWVEVPSYTWTKSFKRGDKIKAWDSEDTLFENMVFLAYIEGASSPYICTSEYEFEKGDFIFAYYKHVQRIPERKYEPYTLETAKQVLGDIVCNKKRQAFRVIRIIEDVHAGLEFEIRSSDEKKNVYSISALKLFNDFKLFDDTPCGVEVKK